MAHGNDYFMDLDPGRCVGVVEVIEHGFYGSGDFDDNMNLTFCQ